MKKRILIFILLLSLLMTCIAYAGSGDGNGSGNGQNKKIALTLESSTPSDGSAKVSRDTIIQLDFNKNICNVKVLDNNKTCFHLTDEKDQVIPITVTFPDDQIQRTYKRQVFIKPKTVLEANTKYRVSVDNTLMAKNGNSIDNAHRITFTTGDATWGETPKILEKLGSNVQAFDSNLAETDASIPKSQDELLNADNKSGLSTKTIAIIAGIAIIGAIVFFTVVATRRNRKSH